MSFSICAIRVNAESSELIRKILEPGIYKLNDWLVFSDDGLPSLNSNCLEHNWFADNICIQTIVGMNGSGKSSLLDIIYRVVNNFGVMILTREEDISNKKKRESNDKMNEKYTSLDDIDDELIYPAYVGGVDADVYFVKDNNFGWINCSHDKIVWHYKDSFVNITTVSTQKQLQEISETFCYTIGINYAAQAYLSYDYRHENALGYLKNGVWMQDNRDVRWIDSVFHKNDGYHLPICLNPFRSHGVLNMEQELSLTYSRLCAIFDSVNKNIPIINGYTYFQTIYHFEPENTYKAYLNADYAYYQWSNSNSHAQRYFSDTFFTPANTLSNAVDPYKPKWNDKEEFIDGFKKLFNKDANETYAKRIIDNYNISFPEGDLPISTWWMLAYLVKKTFTIAANYPTYRKYKNISEIYFFDIELENNQELTGEIDALVDAINKDKSHITLKIRQTINFINDYAKEDMSNYTQDIRLTHTEDNLFVNDNQSIDVQNLIEAQEKLYPPVFKTAIAFKKKKDDGKEMVVSLEQMSSGERQQIFTFTTIAYHIINLLSIKDANRTKYRNINIVLDELEICFHPEFQRTLISNLLIFLQGLGLNKLCDINIILCTHSPFILSDMPKENILSLKEGKDAKKDNKFEKTLCANIYDLLQSKFFMNEYIGAFASKKLSQLIKDVNDVNDGDKLSKAKYLELQKRINRIGDDFIRIKLQAQIDERIGDRKDIEEQLRIARNRVLVLESKLKKK